MMTLFIHIALYVFLSVVLVTVASTALKRGAVANYTLLHNLINDNPDESKGATMLVRNKDLTVDDCAERFGQLSESMSALAPATVGDDTERYKHDWSTMVCYHTRILDLFDELRDCQHAEHYDERLGTLRSNLRALEEIHNRLRASH